MNNDRNLRVIKTARSVKAINAAVENGYWPLVKPVTPSPEIISKYAVLQNKVTGNIEVIYDYRASGYGFENDDESSLVKTAIDFTFYYPHHFENPYAAYLIPADIRIGEEVWLEDLIEDLVGSRWNQGDTYRLQSSEAVWDGKEFVLDHLPSSEATIIG